MPLKILTEPCNGDIRQCMPLQSRKTACIGATVWQPAHKEQLFGGNKKMTQSARRRFLIAALLKEQSQYSKTEIPPSEQEQKILLRSLFNIRMPLPVTDEFLTVQDAYLREEIRQKGITVLSDLEPVQKGIYLWRGDITTLQCDGIVNAANRGLLGCFCPNHGCIDNAIHTFAGCSFAWLARS